MTMKRYFSAFLLSVATIYLMAGCGLKTENNKSEYTVSYDNYKQIIDSLENQYGVAEIQSSLAGPDAMETAHLTGCFFELIDMDNDGIQELLTVFYSPKENKTPYTNNYVVNIYTQDKNKSILLFTHTGLTGFGQYGIENMMPYLALVKAGGNVYLYFTSEKIGNYQGPVYYKKDQSFFSSIIPKEFFYEEELDTADYYFYSWNKATDRLKDILTANEDTKRTIYNNDL